MRNRFFGTLLLFASIVAAMSMTLSAQSNDNDPDTPNRVTQRVDDIFVSALKEGRFLLENNVRTSTTVPPPTKATVEIKRMGTKAIPALVQHSTSENPREQELAVRFLGAIGGEAVVEPLGAVLLKSRYGTSRLLALKVLSEGPWDKIREYVRRAVNDIEPAVRSEALRIEATHN